MPQAVFPWLQAQNTIRTSRAVACRSTLSNCDSQLLSRCPPSGVHFEAATDLKKLSAKRMSCRNQILVTRQRPWQVGRHGCINAEDLPLELNVVNPAGIYYDFEKLPRSRISGPETLRMHVHEKTKKGYNDWARRRIGSNQHLLQPCSFLREEQTKTISSCSTTNPFNCSGTSRKRRQVIQAGGSRPACELVSFFGKAPSLLCAGVQQALTLPVRWELSIDFIHGMVE